MRYALFIILIGIYLGIGSAARAEDGNTYTVEINKGTMIKLPAAASSVIVADPAIADVQVVSPTLVYVNGKSVGETSIFAVGSENRQILHATIEVTHNLSALKRTLSQLFPDARINLR
jgi:pilus assembly protein CpaC